MCWNKANDSNVSEILPIVKAKKILEKQGCMKEGCIINWSKY